MCSHTYVRARTGWDSPRGRPLARRPHLWLPARMAVDNVTTDVAAFNELLLAGFIFVVNFKTDMKDYLVILLKPDP